MIRSEAALAEHRAITSAAALGAGLPSHMWLRVHDRAWISRRLRVSLTDHCNYSCFFCHNEGQGRVRPASLASAPFEEITSIIRIAVQEGVDTLKLTGGEPLLYRSRGGGIVDFIERLSPLRAVTPHLDISLTTNGSLMPEYAIKLREAGLNRVTLSLPTLQPHTFCCLISPDVGLLGRSIAGLRAARDAELSPLKVNVPLYHSDRHRLGNLQELRQLLDTAREFDVAEVRLFTLLWHPDFPQFDAFYQFFSREMRRSLVLLLEHCDAPAPQDTVEMLAELAFSFGSRLYPKVEFGVNLDSLALGFEPMVRSRLSQGDRFQEGPYAMRLGSDGALRPTLNGLPSHELIKAVRHGADDAALGSLYHAALEELP
ncbi:MAG: radical SAM protein [Dactylosporangium sp.]|nr:radical SAM protein [Dactylosporangium sp.]NNJ60031.1 radical SAM protein [Dactylosporangium sp.]